MSNLPPPQRPQEQDHRDQEEGEQEQANGRSVSDIARENAHLKRQRAKHLRAIHRSALRQQIDDAEIREGEHGAKDETDHYDRSDDWQDDLIVAPPEARAVDRGGIEHILRYRREPGEEDHDAERKQPPSMDDRHGNHRQILLPQPLWPVCRIDQSYRYQRPVDDAVKRVEHPHPGQRRQRYRYCPGQNDKRARKPAPRELLHEEHGADLAEQQADDLGTYREDESVGQCPAEDFAVDHLAEVLQTDKRVARIEDAVGADAVV